MNLKHIIFFAILSIFWGGSFAAIKIGIAEMPPFLCVTIRLAISVLLVGVMLSFRKIKWPKKKNVYIQLLLLGFFTLGLPWALLFWGEQYVNAGLASIINATTPIFTIIIAPFLYPSDKIGWKSWLGVMVGFVGVGIIFAPQVSTGENNNILGMLSIVGMALFYGIGIAWLKPLSHKISAFVIMFVEGIGALICVIPLAIIFEWNSIMTMSFSPKSLMAIVYLGVFSTFISQIIFYRLIRETGSVTASSVTYTIPIVGVLLDFFIFDNWVGSHAILGAAVILYGVHLIRSKPKQIIAEAKQPL
ncbi:MAG: DMT family transporter [Pseudomonadota bacterium]